MSSTGVEVVALQDPLIETTAMYTSSSSGKGQQRRCLSPLSSPFHKRSLLTTDRSKTPTSIPQIKVAAEERKLERTLRSEDVIDKRLNDLESRRAYVRKSVFERSMNLDRSCQHQIEELNDNLRKEQDEIQNIAKKKVHTMNKGVGMINVSASPSASSPLMSIRSNDRLVQSLKINMQKSVDDSAMASERKQAQHVRSLNQSVDERKMELAKWKEANRQKLEELEQERVAQQSVVLQQRAVVKKQIDGTVKSDADVRTQMRMLMHHEAGARKKLSDTCLSKLARAIGGARAEIKRTLQRESADVEKEDLRMDFEMKRYALEQKQLMLVDAMLKQEKQHAKSYAEKLENERKQRDEDNKKAQEEAMKRREQARERHEADRQRIKDREDAVRALQERRKSELKELFEERRRIQSELCAKGVQEIQHRVEVVRRQEASLHEHENVAWEEQVRVVKEARREQRQKEIETENVCRSIRLDHYQQKHEAEHGVSSAFSDMVKMEEQRLADQRQADKIERQARRQRKMERLAKEKVQRALEIKEDTLFAREVVEHNQLTHTLEKKEHVKKLRDEYVATHLPIYPDAVSKITVKASTPQPSLSRSALTTTPISNTKSNNSTMTNTNWGGTNTSLVHFEKPMPKRDHSSKTLAYPTQKMLQDPNLSPTLREKAHHMLSLMKEVNAGESRVYASTLARVKEVSPHLLQSSVERELMREELREKTRMPNMHDDVPPVASTSKRLYDPDKMTGKRVELEVPSKSHAVGKLTQKDEERVTRLYTQPIARSADAHQKLFKKYVPENGPAGLTVRDFDVGAMVERLSMSDVHVRKQRQEQREANTIRRVDADRPCRKLKRNEQEQITEKLANKDVEKKEDALVHAYDKHFVKHEFKKLTKEEIDESAERLCVITKP
eukprot:PhM_4_TR13359/c0_g1_i1/m.14009